MLEIFLFLFFGQHPAYTLEAQTQTLIIQLLRSLEPSAGHSIVSLDPSITTLDSMLPTIGLAQQASDLTSSYAGRSVCMISHTKLLTLFY